MFMSMTLLAAALTFSSCGGDTSGDNNAGGTTVYAAGDRETSSADSVSFTMVYVPGGMTFPAGPDDDRTATVQKAYWIAETELTYQLWQKVYSWATDAARGGSQYHFANAGSRGAYLVNTTHLFYDSGHETDPVTNANWRDFMVWCNAFTEWYNAQKGTGYECVYTYSGGIIRDSRDSNATACDGAVAGSTAKGFRLLSGDEWELAARYRGSDTTNVVSGTKNNVDFSAMTVKWTTGNSASGATTYYNDVTIIGADPAGKIANNEVAVYKYFFNGPSDMACEYDYANTTVAVKSKAANALGLYDMGGNVQEWCFDLDSGLHMVRGGDWNNHAGSLQVGMYTFGSPGDEFSTIGLRFARSAQ
jgi:hypothetical protein